MAGHARTQETRLKIAAAQRAAWADPKKRAARIKKQTKYSGTPQERRNEACRVSHAKHREKRLAEWRQRNERKLAKTAGRPRPALCEVCGKPGVICFDHSHAVGSFRGWLCGGCNMALGHAKDDPVVLRKPADYLEGKHQPSL